MRLGGRGNWGLFYVKSIVFEQISRGHIIAVLLNSAKICSDISALTDATIAILHSVSHFITVFYNLFKRKMKKNLLRSNVFKTIFAQIQQE